MNNAGIGAVAAVEDFDDDEVLRVFDTNVFGPIRVARAALPHMREQRSGRIINIGSLSGVVPSQFRGIYSATKAALSSISEAMYYELHPWNIHVAVIEPGFFETSIGDKRMATRRQGASDYAPLLEQYEQGSTPGGSQRAEPTPVIDVIVAAATKTSPKRHYLVGKDAEALGAMRKTLPDEELAALVLRSMPTLEGRHRRERRQPHGSLRARDRVLPLGRKTYVMAILNLTNDSFSGDGVGTDLDAAVRRAVQAQAMAPTSSTSAPRARARTCRSREADEEAAQRRWRRSRRVRASRSLLVSVDTYKRAGRRGGAAGRRAHHQRHRRLDGRHGDGRGGRQVRRRARHQLHVRAAEGPSRSAAASTTTSSASTSRSCVSASRCGRGPASRDDRSSSIRASRSGSRTTKTSRCCGGWVSFARLGCRCSWRRRASTSSAA